MLPLAASLADGIPVNLRDALTGIDDRRPSHGLLLSTHLRIIGRWPHHVHGHAPCDYEMSLGYQ
jgi:hypothetical protein